MNPEPRIGDAERETASGALGEHFAAGRLTREEYDERSERVWSARTASDLAPLFVDLPSLQHSAPRAASRAEPHQRGTGRTPPRSGWWVAVPLVLLVLLVLVVLDELPWLVLLVVGWVMFAKLSRHRGHRRV